MYQDRAVRFEDEEPRRLWQRGHKATCVDNSASGDEQPHSRAIVLPGSDRSRRPALRDATFWRSHLRNDGARSPLDLLLPLLGKAAPRPIGS